MRFNIWQGWRFNDILLLYIDKSATVMSQKQMNDTYQPGRPLILVALAIKVIAGLASFILISPLKKGRRCGASYAKIAVNLRKNLG